MGAIRQEERNRQIQQQARRCPRRKGETQEPRLRRSIWRMGPEMGLQGRQQVWRE